MRLFPRRHRAPLATREASPSSSLLPVAGTLHEAASHERCERHLTDASTLNWRESFGITKYVRLATFRKEQNANINSAVAQTQSLKTWGEKVNGEAHAIEAQERSPVPNQAGTGIDHGRSRDNTAAPSRAYQNTSATASRDSASTRTNVRCAPAHAVEVAPPDELLFAPYQPIYRPPYDLTNPFDRTNIGIVIRGQAERCEDYLALIGRLRRGNVMGADDFLQRSSETIATLRQHRRAISRLYEISGGNQ